MELLIEQIAEIERQLSDGTLPHSDQQLLDQMWDELNEQLEAMEIDDDAMEVDDTSIHTQPKRSETPMTDDGGGSSDEFEDGMYEQAAEI